MLTITASGNLGKDAELRTTQAGDDVLSFSVGAKQGWGDNATTNWFRCSVWGKRASSLKQHLLKGVKVVVQGEFSVSEYEGKTQLNVRVNEVEFMSRAAGDAKPQSSRGGGGGGFNDDLDDSVPFASCGLAHEHRAS